MSLFVYHNGQPPVHLIGLEGQALGGAYTSDSSALVYGQQRAAGRSLGSAGSPRLHKTRLTLDTASLAADAKRVSQGLHK